MELGTTIAIFLLVAAALMLSFCLLLRYFSNQLRRQLTQPQSPQLIEQILYRSNEQITNGAYEQFRERRLFNQEIEMKQMPFEEDRFLNKSDLRQVLDLSNNIYGLTKLRKRLNDDVPPLTLDTNRSIGPLKSFNFSRMDTAQTQKQKKFYSFVQKIVGYNDKGLNIVEVTVKSVKKVEGQYQLTTEVECKLQQPSSNFCDRLESQGFYPNIYGYYKYVGSIDVTSLKDQETIQAKGLSLNSSKQSISEDDFKLLKQEMLS